MKFYDAGFFSVECPLFSNGDCLRVQYQCYIGNVEVVKNALETHAQLMGVMLSVFEITLLGGRARRMATEFPFSTTAAQK